ncbi:MAG: sulfur carrier protein ThiS [Acidobacteria bacterium]|nr:sulfur carrier protein ThiS [Acidobacteriota bacterium]
MDQTIDIRLNGEAHTLAAPATLLSLLAAVGRDPRAVAIEHNGEIVRRARYGETPLESGDRVEVVHFVQGG